MRIHSSKTLTFQLGEEEVSIKNHDIKDMPDWIEKTIMFELAKKDGTISVIENSKQQKAAENGVTPSKGKGKGGKSKQKTDTPPDEQTIDPNDEPPTNPEDK